MDYKRNLIGLIIWPAFYNFCLAEGSFLKGDAVKSKMFISIIYLLICCGVIQSTYYCSKRGITSHALVVWYTHIQANESAHGCFFEDKSMEVIKRILQYFHSSLFFRDLIFEIFNP